MLAKSRTSYCRYYREKRVETPSNRGGVSKEFFESLERRRERDRQDRQKTGLVSTTSRRYEKSEGSRSLKGENHVPRSRRLIFKGESG